MDIIWLHSSHSSDLFQPARSIDVLNTFYTYTGRGRLANGQRLPAASNRGKTAVPHIERMSMQRWPISKWKKHKKSKKKDNFHHGYFLLCVACSVFFLFIYVLFFIHIIHNNRRSLFDGPNPFTYKSSMTSAYILIRICVYSHIRSIACYAHKMHSIIK